MHLKALQVKITAMLISVHLKLKCDRINSIEAAEIKI